MANSNRALRLSMIALCSLLGGCAFPYVPVTAPETVGVTQGSSVTVLVNTGAAICPTSGDPLPCADITGLLFDFEVAGMPTGMTARIDTDLQSATTPGLVRLTLDVGLAVAPNNYDVAIHAMLDGVSVGRTRLSVGVLPANTQPPVQDIVDVSAGLESVFAILDDGSGLSWGGNAFGELGNGTRTSRSLAGPIAELSGIDSISGNLSISSSRSVAMLDDGTVWLWGDNSDRVLIQGSPRDLLLPLRRLNLNDIAHVGVGQDHVVALARDGTVYTWGENSLGQLGDGSTRDRLFPGVVAGLPSIRAIAAGSNFTLALAVDGTVWSWGSNSEGQLGRGDQFRGGSDGNPALVVNIASAEAIAAGRSHVLVLLSDGTVVAFGRNTSGQLGDGTETGRDAPVPSVGIDDVTAIAAGGSYSLALRSGGDLWGWGNNGTGQILNDQGDDNLTQPLPAPIDGLPDIIAIAAGSEHSVALSDCGQVWTFGSNDVGERGGGTFDVFRDSRAHLVPSTGRAGECEEIGLRVAMAGAATGNVISPDVDLRCLSGSSCIAYEPVVIGRNVAVTLRAQSTSAALFVGWAGDCTGTDAEVTVSFDAPATCVAQFESTQATPYLLSVTETGGQVSSSPPADSRYGPSAIDCGALCSAVFPEGTLVTLTAQPDPGYEFLGWGADCNASTLETNVLIDRSKRCDARFRPYDVSVQVNGEGSVTSAPNGINCPQASCAYTPREGVVTLTATPALGWFFSGWSGDCRGFAGQTQLTMDGDRACAATFLRDPNVRFLRMLVSGPGSIDSAPNGIAACGSDCTAVFATGATVTLLASPDPVQTVMAWGDDCAAPGGLAISLVMSSDRVCSVEFVEIDIPDFPVAQFSNTPESPRVGEVVTFSSTSSFVFDPNTGNGDPQGIDTVEWDFGFDGIVDVGGSRSFASVVQRVFQAPGNTTVRLRVTGGNNGPRGTAGEAFEQRDITVLPEVGPQFGLTVSKAGAGSGIVRSSPIGLLACDESCQSTAPVFFESGTLVRLSASASSGSAFTGWSGNCGNAAASISVPMTEARNCIANFQRTRANLSVTVNGSGTVTGSGIDCGADCATSVPIGTPIVLDAQPAPGFRLESLAGCDTVSGTQCTLSMASDRFVTATFVVQTFNLQIVNTGGGRVTSLPTGIDCGADCNETYDAATAVSLTATPNPGFQFDGWGLACSGTATSTQVVMDGDRVCRANFSPLAATFTLTVQRVGSSSAGGRITVADPPGSPLDCGESCTATFPANTTVVLQNLNVPGAFFAFWTFADCDSQVDGACLVTMDRDRSVTAVFE